MKRKAGFGYFVVDHLATFVFATIALFLFSKVILNNPMSISMIPLDLIRRASAYIIIAIAVGGIMMLGGADLSAGRVMGLCALVAAALLQSPEAMNRVFPDSEPSSVISALIIVILIGAAIGAVNGILVSGLKAPTFIVTLATQIAVYGGMLMFLGMGTNMGQNIANLTFEYRDFVTSGSIIPNYVIYAFVITMGMWAIYRFTPFGKNMRAIGYDRAAAKASGVKIILTTVIVFAISGALYGFNGFIEAARVGGPGAAAGSNAEIDAILACLIGGLSIKGGVGGVGNIVIGVVIIQLISVCLQWMSISANLIYIIKGLCLCLAVVLDMVRWKIKRVDK